MSRVEKMSKAQRDAYRTRLTLQLLDSLGALTPESYVTLDELERRFLAMSDEVLHLVDGQRCRCENAWHEHEARLDRQQGAIVWWHERQSTFWDRLRWLLTGR